MGRRTREEVLVRVRVDLERGKLKRTGKTPGESAPK